MNWRSENNWAKTWGDVCQEMTADVTGEQVRGKVTKMLGYQDKEFGLYLKGNMEKRFLNQGSEERCCQRYVHMFVCFTTPHCNNRTETLSELM